MTLIVDELMRLADRYASDACRASEHQYGIYGCPARAELREAIRAAFSGAPVAWYEAEESCRGMPLNVLLSLNGMMCHSGRFHGGTTDGKPPVTSNPVWPLYATPPSSAPHGAAAPGEVPTNPDATLPGTFDTVEGLFSAMGVPTAGTPAAAVPTYEQVSAALKAACLHDTPESRKDMTRALIAAWKLSAAPAAPAVQSQDAEHAAWLADKIVALGDYGKEAAAMLRRWPFVHPAAPQTSRTSVEGGVSAPSDGGSAQDATDAIRYRWWRDNSCGNPGLVAKLLAPCIFSAEVDEVIDAQLAKEGAR